MGTRKSNYYKNLSVDMKLKYDSKIQQCGGTDPYTIKDKDVSVNRSDFPEITLLDIGNYMCSVSPITKRAFKAYKSMESYSFFESGYVLKLEAIKNENTAILKGKVKHSLRTSATPHQVWILAKMDGEIICTHCTCISELSESCSHIGAVCFAAMNVTESTETVESAMGSSKSKYYESLFGEVKLRYDSKIELCGRTDPYTIKDKDLSVNRTDFPEITLLDIGNYMIHSASPYTKRSFKAYKSMEAYSFFESGYVLKLGAIKTENKAILKGKVQHSMRMNATPHKVWILAKMDGEIICAHCTCVAGLSESCSHVGAVCFAVMNFTESTTETTSVTDVLCKWNVPKFNDVSMSSVQDIQWTSSSYLIEPTTIPEDSEPTFRAHCNSLTKYEDSDVDNFLDLIHFDEQESTLRTLIYPNEIRRASKIRDDVFLATLYSVNNKNKSLRELIEIGKTRHLKISNAEIEEAARLTEPNSKSKCKFWVALRRGRVTGCNFKDCCVTAIENPSLTTINRIINPIKNLDHVPSVKYQKKNKKKAIKCYLNQAVLENHESFEYRESGLIMNAKYPYFAASSDGMVSCECHGKRCIEIKCYKILESAESFDVLTRKPNNILNKIDDDFFMEQDHELFYKLQMQIHLSEVKYCELVVWSPINTLTLRVNADTKFWNEAKEKATKFHAEVLMPELLGKFFNVHKELPQPVEENGAACLELLEENSAQYLGLIGLEIERLDSEDE